MAAKKSTMTKKGIDPETGYVDLTGDVRKDIIGFVIRNSDDTPDVFKASPQAPGATYMELAAVVSSDDVSQQMDAIKEFMNEVLLDGYGDRFKDRLSDKDNPIDISQAIGAFEYLIKQYGGDMSRPT